MINKLILPSSFGFNDPLVRLVPLYSRGVDTSMYKCAGVFDSVFKDIRPIKGKTVIHILAVGDEESYGPNRNGDGFSRADNVTAHKLFKELGHVFKNHKNNNPDLSVGDVLHTAHNDIMDRIELLLGLDNEKCRNEIQAFENNEDLPTSMGSSQEYDVCSYCGHRAPTAREHCSHIQDMLGQVLADGTKIYMKNPNPRYFDISLVHKPADRIAYSLRKVAGLGVVGGHELALEAGLVNPFNPKLATLQVLAELKKQIPMRMKIGPLGLKSASVQELRRLAKTAGIEQVLGHLTARGYVLSAGDFAKIALDYDGQDADAAGDEDVLKDLLSDYSVVESVNPPKIQMPVHTTKPVERDLEESCSMENEPVRLRVMRITIIQPGEMKLSSVRDPLFIRGLAQLYGQYKLAVAHAHRQRHDLLLNIAASF